MCRPTRLLAPLVFLACISLAACGGSPVALTSSAPTQSSSGSGSSTSTSASTGYTISGVVSGTSGASVALMGPSTNSTATDSSGNFSFARVGAGNYTISASKTGYVFTPVSRAAIVSSASLTDVSFAATASTAAAYTISGTVNGSVAAGVVITLNGSNVGSAVTDLSGNYTFTGLISGTYTVTASLDGYSFTSPLIVSLGSVDSANNNFTSTAATGGSLAFTAVSTLPEATIGSAYSSSVVKSITGGTAPYHYHSDTLAAGTPPLAMIVNPNGNLTGTPSVPGQYNFSVCATDSAGETSPCEATSITVVAAQPTQPTPTPIPVPAPTVSLASSPATITSGSSSVLTWSSQNADSCTASGGWTGTKAVSGTITVTPTITATFILTCAGSSGSGHASAIITVDAAVPAPVAPTVTLTASAAIIPAGSSSTLIWSSKNATSCNASGGWTGTQATSGTHSVSPGSTTTYMLACSSSSGTAQTATKIAVNPAVAPAPTVKLTASSTTIASGGSTTLTWSTTNASSCTASGGWTGSEVTSGTKSVSPTATASYTLACTGSGGNAQASADVTVNTGAPTPPASGTSWVYYNGLFDWPGDYSFVAVPNYTDTSGGPLSGASDIKITITSPYGGWLPYAQNWNFNSAPYTKLTFALKPTVANQQWSVYFVKVGDIPVGIYLDVTKYGPAPVVGQWNTYTVPLLDLGVLGTAIYKFCIQDKTGLSSNVWYVDNVGFAP
jgi:Carboxypeptidase regulatory-like domain